MSYWYFFLKKINFFCLLSWFNLKSKHHIFLIIDHKDCMHHIRWVRWIWIYVKILWHHQQCDFQLITWDNRCSLIFFQSSIKQLMQVITKPILSLNSSSFCLYHENHNDFSWSDANNQSSKSLPRDPSKQIFHVGFLCMVKKPWRLCMTWILDFIVRS